MESVGGGGAAIGLWGWLERKNLGEEKQKPQKKISKFSRTNVNVQDGPLRMISFVLFFKAVGLTDQIWPLSPKIVYFGS